MRVCNQRVPEVGEPARARRPLDGPPPAKWIDPGGEVVTTTSIPSRRTIRIAAGIAVRFQVTLASGTSNRRAVKLAWTSARSRPSAARSSSAGFRALSPT